MPPHLPFLVSKGTREKLNIADFQPNQRGTFLSLLTAFLCSWVWCGQSGDWGCWKAKGFPYPSGCIAEWLAYDADDDLLSISLLTRSKCTTARLAWYCHISRRVKMQLKLWRFVYSSDFSSVHLFLFLSACKCVSRGKGMLPKRNWKVCGMVSVCCLIWQ